MSVRAAMLTTFNINVKLFACYVHTSHFAGLPL